MIPEPPAAETEERAVLGAMLASDHGLKLALSGLRVEHFGSERHQAIYAAASRLATRSEAVDAITVSAELRNQPAVAGAGTDYLSKLASNCPVPSHVPTYASAIIEAAELRAKRSGALEILQGVGERDRPRIQRGIEQAVQTVRHDDSSRTPMELADEYVADLYDESPGIIYPLPWPRMNYLLSGGLHPGDVTAIMAWSGMGKTTALDQLMAKLREDQRRTLLFDTEMSRKQRVTRFVSAKTGIPYAKLVLKELNERQRGLVVEVMNDIPWAFCEAEKWTVEEICQELAVQDVDVAAIDTLHAIPYGDEKGLREIMGDLRGAAKATGTHLIVVCHMNMARAKEATRPAPTKRDILGSGSIEQAATNIIAVHRDQETSGKLKETARLIALKSRHGLEGECKVRLIPGGYGFEPIKRKPSQQTMDYREPETIEEDPLMVGD